ncbi:hypothetical protein FYJ63_01265 [Mobiluncus holmesii]|uniref:Uncharacterized protein n=2 Tax=Mobiluncus porci TaxID=2652278 RepID=A0A7K0K0D5_9ACTO|nr:hypothetical protein [Mobiluncus porci]
MRTFTVTARRMKNGRWAISNEELGAYSQVSRLDQIEEEMREALAYLAGINENEIEISIQPELDESVSTALEHLIAARNAEQAATANTKEISANTVRLLRNQGYSMRDIGTLLGVSHQRVSQLAAA